MLKVGIIIGSTRPNRIGAGVARWVHEVARKREDADFVLVDLEELNLPLLDEPVSPAMSSEYQKEHTRHWSKIVRGLDAFIFVTPEYNHSTSGALKNAIDFLYEEWNDKVAGFVSYGSVGGTRAVEHLRLIMAELQIATVRAQLPLYLRSDFENYQTLKPAPHHEKGLHQLIDQIVRWGEAFRRLRLGEEVQDIPDDLDMISPGLQ